MSNKSGPAAKSRFVKRNGKIINCGNKNLRLRGTSLRKSPSMNWIDTPTPYGFELRLKPCPSVRVSAILTAEEKQNDYRINI